MPEEPESNKGPETPAKSRPSIFDAKSQDADPKADPPAPAPAEREQRKTDREAAKPSSEKPAAQGTAKPSGQADRKPAAQADAKPAAQRQAKPTGSQERPAAAASGGDGKRSAGAPGGADRAAAPRPMFFPAPDTGDATASAAADRPGESPGKVAGKGAQQAASTPPRPMFFPPRGQAAPSDDNGRTGMKPAASKNPSTGAQGTGKSPAPGKDATGDGSRGDDRMPSDVRELIGTAEFFAVPPQPEPDADLRASVKGSPPGARDGATPRKSRPPSGKGAPGKAATGRDTTAGVPPRKQAGERRTRPTLRGLAASRPRGPRRPAAGPAIALSSTAGRVSTVAALVRLAATIDDRRKGAMRLARPVASALILALLLGAAISVPAGTLVAGRVDAAAKSLPNLDDLQPLWQSQRTEVLNRKGDRIATLVGDEDRIVIPYEEMPKSIRDAVVAAEDRRFYEHHGVDEQGIIRAALSNAASGETEQGGSTITQQYVRTSYPDLKDRTVLRKVKEASLAAQVELRMSKEEILAGYLNRVYFGAGYYGVEAASNGYFGHPAKKLKLEEAATLAGILRAPEGVNPRSKDPKERARAKQLRDTVLLQMVELKMISQEQADKARKAKLKVKAAESKRNKRYNHFVDYIIHELVGDAPSDDSDQKAVARSNRTGDQRLGRTYAERRRNLFEGGLIIHTTLDSTMQRAAEAAVIRYIPATPKANGGHPVNAGMAAIDPRNGEIMAMVGSRDYSKVPFNLAVQADRSPGSTFKTFVLAAAIEEGISPDSGWSSAGSGPAGMEVCGVNWEFDNYSEGAAGGVMSLRRATAASTNGVFARVMGEVCPKKVVALARRLGVTIPTRSEGNPAIALGGGADVNVLEMANGYASLAANGTYHKPMAVTKITRRDGEVVLENKPKGKEAMEPILAWETTQVLKGVIQSGTASANGQIGRPAAGKTGTAQEYGDAWFAGYTPQLSAAVWVGNSENNSTFTLHGSSRVTGGSYPTMIWRDFMIEALKDKDPLDFERPPGEPHYTRTAPPPPPTTVMVPGQPGDDFPDQPPSTGPDETFPDIPGNPIPDPIPEPEPDPTEPSFPFPTVTGIPRP